MIGWLVHFDERQRRLIQNCRDYAEKDPAGVPGHNLMVIIGRMADLLDKGEKNVRGPFVERIPSQSKD